MSRSSSYNLIFRDLGSMPYAEAFALQRDLQQDVIASRDPASGHATQGYVLFVEHEPPVITAPVRASRDHLLASPEMLQQAGIELHETDRGGDITYHGPGQLVVYPILDLNALGLRLRRYMAFLEEVVIDVLAEFGITGHRDPDATGVWVDLERHKSTQAGPSPAPGAVERSDASKICAMGVRLTRWVSMHGLALNVAPDLSHFNYIIPCGLVGRRVTSMREILGDSCPEMDEVKRAVLARFRVGPVGLLERQPRGPDADGANGARHGRRIYPWYLRWRLMIILSLVTLAALLTWHGRNELVVKNSGTAGPMRGPITIQNVRHDLKLRRKTHGEVHVTFHLDGESEVTENIVSYEFIVIGPSDSTAGSVLLTSYPWTIESFGPPRQAEFRRADGSKIGPFPITWDPQQFKWDEQGLAVHSVSVSFGDRAALHPGINQQLFSMRAVVWRVIGKTVFGMLFLVLVLYVFIGVRLSIRPKAGRCPACGYRLRGLTERGCPECGWERD